MPYNDPPWHPMSSPRSIKTIGKLNEELGELQAAASRCLIQGMDGREPNTGKVNSQWLEEEIADVLANIDLVVEHFKLGTTLMAQRIVDKKSKLKTWHDQA